MHIANSVCDMPEQDKFRGSKSVLDRLSLCVIDELQYKFIENQQKNIDIQLNKWYFMVTKNPQ